MKGREGDWRRCPNYSILEFWKSMRSAMSITLQTQTLNLLDWKLPFKGNKPWQPDRKLCACHPAGTAAAAGSPGSPRICRRRVGPGSQRHVCAQSVGSPVQTMPKRQYWFIPKRGDSLVAVSWSTEYSLPWKHTI